MAVKHVFFVHGYSVVSLSTYAQCPQLLRASGYPATDIFLSALNSLDDAITCDDLAQALEDHVSALVAGASPRLDVSDTAFICHSTGSIIARRWILNRLASRLPVPSHFISISGANHGSTLAQLGETIAAKVFRAISQGTQVGAGVLTDLDYGSDFLLRLNRQWLVARNAPVGDPTSLASLYEFNMIGDSIGDWVREIIWETKEPGSDSTVRISGSNLNYRILDADADSGKITVMVPSVPSPHLVLAGYSHTGQVGILDSVTSVGAPPFAATLEALKVDDAESYARVVARWDAVTNDWSSKNPTLCNSTLIFHLNDRANRPINDSHIALADKNQSFTDVSPSLVNLPIQNEAVNASVSFYLRSAQFRAGAPHTVSIAARSGSSEIDYDDVTYTTAPTQDALVLPNCTTYVFVTMNRKTAGTCAVYGLDSNPSNASWANGPFPPGSIP